MPKLRGRRLSKSFNYTDYNRFYFATGITLSRFEDMVIISTFKHQILLPSLASEGERNGVIFWRRDVGVTLFMNTEIIISVVVVFIIKIVIVIIVGLTAIVTGIVFYVSNCRYLHYGYIIVISLNPKRYIG